jgi:hypothetical protein
MDGIALIVALGLAGLSYIHVDWKHDAKSALAQVQIMAGGLILLCVYLNERL